MREEDTSDDVLKNVADLVEALENASADFASKEKILKDIQQRLGVRYSCSKETLQDQSKN